jgi:hypothetical protein
MGENHGRDSVAGSTLHLIFAGAKGAMPRQRALLPAFLVTAGKASIRNWCAVDRGTVGRVGRRQPIALRFDRLRPGTLGAVLHRRHVGMEPPKTAAASPITPNAFIPTIMFIYR